MSRRVLNEPDNDDVPPAKKQCLSLKRKSSNANELFTMSQDINAIVQGSQVAAGHELLESLEMDNSQFRGLEHAQREEEEALGVDMDDSYRPFNEDWHSMMRRKYGSNYEKKMGVAGKDNDDARSLNNENDNSVPDGAAVAAGVAVGAAPGAGAFDDEKHEPNYGHGKPPRDAAVYGRRRRREARYADNSNDNSNDKVKDKEKDKEKDNDNSNDNGNGNGYDDGNGKFFVNSRNEHFVQILGRLNMFDGNEKAVVIGSQEQYGVHQAALEIFKQDISIHGNVPPDCPRKDLPVIIIVHDNSVSARNFDRDWTRNLKEALSDPYYKDSFQVKWIYVNGLMDWQANYKNVYLPQIKNLSNGGVIRIFFRNFGASYNEYGRNNGIWRDEAARNKLGSDVWIDDKNGLKHLLDNEHAFIVLAQYAYRKHNSTKYIGGYKCERTFGTFYLRMEYKRDHDYKKLKIGSHLYKLECKIFKATTAILKNDNENPLLIDLISNAKQHTLRVDWAGMDEHYPAFQHQWNIIARQAGKNFARFT